MNIFRRIARALKARRGAYERSAPILDHVPVHASGDWRKQRLIEAAQKHGKPFKCAGDEMPREVMVGGKQLVALQGGKPASYRADKVTQLSHWRKDKDTAEPSLSS